MDWAAIIELAAKIIEGLLVTVVVPWALKGARDHKLFTVTAERERQLAELVRQGVGYAEQRAKEALKHGDIQSPVGSPDEVAGLPSAAKQEVAETYVLRRMPDADVTDLRERITAEVGRLR